MVCLFGKLTVQRVETLCEWILVHFPFGERGFILINKMSQETVKSLPETPRDGEVGWFFPLKALLKTSTRITRSERRQKQTKHTH